MVKVPCALVVTPRLVPLIKTVTPSKGADLASVTFPVMVAGGRFFKPTNLFSVLLAFSAGAILQRQSIKQTE